MNASSRHGRAVLSRLGSFVVLLLASTPAWSQGEREDGFRSLFNGTDLSGWVVPEGDGGHWRVVDGVIDYDARSEAKGDKNLRTEEEFGDFILKIDWRIKETSGLFDMPIVLSDGSYLRDAEGNKITIKRPNADSGIFLRGHPKAQLNIWCWSTGSGEMYGYRNNPRTPAEIRAALTPRVNADNPVGEWNRFVIVLIDNRLTVLLNNHLIIENALVPDLPDRGPLVLQHHGGPDKDGNLRPASSLVQFRNIWIKPLDGPGEADGKRAAREASPARESELGLDPIDWGDTRNAHRAGAVILSGQPPAERFAELASQGVRTVITLRAEEELDWDEREVVESAGMDFVPLRFRGAENLTDEIFDEARKELRRAVDDRQVLLHCASANRVGAIWLAHRALDGGVDLARAREEAAKVGLRSEAYEERAIDYVRRMAAE